MTCLDPGDIVQTWVIDGLPYRGSTLIRVSEISSIGNLHNLSVQRSKEGEESSPKRVVRLPVFHVTLRGQGDHFVCCREDTPTLVYAEQKDEHNWTAHPQPATSPTHLATQKFHDDLVIAWAEAIKAQRA